MSRVIDQRVVEMKFDNKEFESNIKSSMSTLDRFKQALKLDNVTKGFGEINAAAKGINLDNVAAGVEAIKDRFSTLGVIGMQVLQNLTNAAMGLAANGLKKVYDAVVGGGIRRATNIENAKFSLQGLIGTDTPEKLAEIKGIMDDAMESVDGTAYAYDEAAKAASMFAATGMRSGEEMLGSLKGIAGVAAMTNSEYSSIAQIFTTVSGNGRLMGDQLLQLSTRGLNAAATISGYFNDVNSGTVQASDDVKAAIKSLSGGLEVSESDIRAWVSKGKISFDMFASAMNNAFGEHAKEANKTFAGSLANVRAALARIGEPLFTPLIEQEGPLVNMFNAVRERINDVKRALSDNNVFALFTESVIDVVNTVTDFLRNDDLTQKIGETIKHLRDTIEPLLELLLADIPAALGQIIKPIATGIGHVLPLSLSSAIDKIGEFIHYIDELVYGFEISDETSNNLRLTFAGLASIVDLIIRAFISLIKFMKPIWSGMGTLASKILIVTGALGKQIYEFRNYVKANNLFLGILTELKLKFMELTYQIKNSFVGEALGKTFEHLKIGASKWGEELKKIGDIIKNSKAYKVLADALERLSAQFNNLKTSAVYGMAKALGALSNFDFSPPSFDKFNEALSKALESLGNFLEKILSFKLPSLGFKKAADEVDEFGNKIEKVHPILDSIKKVFTTLIDILKGLFTQSKTTTEGVMSLGSQMLGMFGGGVLLVNIKKIFDAITDGITSAADIPKQANGILKNVKEILGGVKDVLKSYQKEINANIVKKIAVSIALLAGSIFVLALLPQEKMWGAIAGLAALSGVLLGVTKYLTKMEDGELTKGKFKNVSTSLLVMGLALSVFAKSVRKLGALSWDELIRGLIGVGVGMAEMLAAVWVLDKYIKAENAGKMIAIGGSMVVVAVAMNVLAAAIKQVAATDPTAMFNGLFVIGLGLAAMVGAIAAIEKLNLNKNAAATLAVSAAFIVLAASLRIVAGCIKLLGDMPLDQLYQGAIAVGGALVLMTAALATISAIGGETAIMAGAGFMLLAGAVAVLALGLTMLTPMLLLIGNTPLATLATGIISVIAAIGGLAAVASFGSTPLLLLGAALLMVGAATTLAGIGLKDIALAFTMTVGSLLLLSTMSDTAAQNVANAITIIGSSFLTLGPALGQAVAEAITSLVEKIAESSERIKAAVLTILDMLLGLLFGYFETIATRELDFLLTMINIFKDHAKEIVDAVVDLLLTILRALDEHIEEIGQTAYNIVFKFIGVVKENIPKCAETGVELIVTYINAMANAVTTHHKELEDAFSNLMDAVLVLLTGCAKKFIPKGVGFIVSIIQGVVQMWRTIMTKFTDLIADILKAIGVPDEWVETGKKFIQSIINGIADMADALWNKVREIGEGIVSALTGSLEEKSPSRASYRAGKYFDQGLANGIDDYSKQVNKSTIKMGDKLKGIMESKMQEASDSIMQDYTPTISPVMDLSNMDSGMGDISKMFDDTKTQELAWQASADGNFNMMADLTRQMNGNLGNLNNDDVVNELSLLRGDMSSMNDRLSRLQVVLDTGTMVGAMGPGLDNYLGNMSVLAGRGVLA